MSKRHQSSRRKSYGRRQHELRERTERRHQPEWIEAESHDFGVTPQADQFAFLDPRTPRLRFAIGD